ncbi:Fanconi anemia group I protein-like [Sycon ciliatum]|uniref:Fanconi anemia group I protein-like n=1 Tax=Sycon ciliatum TaxID=27933 RepID=UPI0031F6080B
MERRIISLYGDNSKDVLEATLDKLNSEQLKAFVVDAIRTSSTDPVQLTKALCFGSPVEKSRGLERRKAVFHDVLDCVNDETQGDKTCGDVVGVLMMEVDAFPVEQLAELCDYFLGKIKAGEVANGRCLELFPKVLSSIQWMPNVPLVGDCSGQMTGAAYKSHMINKVCSCKWSSGVVIHLAAMFRDVTMTTEELRFVLEKVVRMLDGITLTELPPLVYQLLLLANKGHKRLVLDGLCTYFSKLDKQSMTDDTGKDLQAEAPADLRPTQGTVILHITFAAKQDQELGREFVKTLKVCQQRSSSSVLSPFVLALALSLARIRRFEEPVFEILTSAISRSYRDAEKRKMSRWAYETSPVVSNIASLLMDVCRLTGWEHVMQGLVQLGFLLMDSNTPKSTGFCADTPQRQTCALGSQVLLETFKVHDAVRADILQQILNRIVVKTSSSAEHYLDLLTAAAVHSPQTLLDSLPKVREAFDYLSYLPLSSAIGLLRSVQPLMNLSASLKDSLILVLRKALFSREVESRKVGLAGFLLLLRKLKVLGGCVPCSQASQPWSASQIQVEVHSQVRPSGHEALCLDILGNIRRCMTQQMVIRKMLYQGLYHVLVANPELRTSVLDLLRRQLELYYIADAHQASPVSLESCFTMSGDVAKCNEPVGDLLLAVQSCLEQCLHWLDTAEDDDVTADERTIIDKTQKMVSGIVRRLQKCELEDFDLDKSAEYSTATSVGAKNHMSAGLVWVSTRLL